MNYQNLSQKINVLILVIELYNKKIDTKCKSTWCYIIAGKGHEEEQFYKNKIIKTSDAKIVKKLKIKIQEKYKKTRFLQNKKIIKNFKKKNWLILMDYQLTQGL